MGIVEILSLVPAAVAWLSALLSSVTAVTGPTLVQPSLGWPVLAVALVLSPEEWQVNYIRLNDHSGHPFHRLWESLGNSLPSPWGA